MIEGFFQAESIKDWRFNDLNKFLASLESQVYECGVANAKIYSFG